MSDLKERSADRSVSYKVTALVEKNTVATRRKDNELHSRRERTENIYEAFILSEGVYRGDADGLTGGFQFHNIYI